MGEKEINKEMEGKMQDMEDTRIKVEQHQLAVGGAE